MKKKPVLITKTYGFERSWRSKAEAIAFFAEGVRECEGNERRRYERILERILNGETYCTDEE